jgi:hypothetical protein
VKLNLHLAKHNRIFCTLVGALCILALCQPLQAQSSHIAQSQTTLSVDSVTPGKNTLASLPNVSISVTFSDSINQSTITNSAFVVNGSITGRHQGLIMFDAAGKTATYTPITSFAYGEKVQVTLTSAILSPSGGALSGGYSWAFQVKTRYGSGRYGLTPSAPMTLTATFGLATGDFNKDGYPDVAATDSAHNTVNVLMNNRHGGFLTPKSYAVGISPRAIVAADVDADGSIDLIVANEGSNDISVLKNDGSGSFAAAVSYAVGSNPSALAAADIDNDGDIDLAIANFSGNSVTIFFNDGTGSFTLPQTLSVGNGPSGIAFADFNGDGLVDAAITNRTSNSLTILKNVAGSISVDTTYMLDPSAAPNGLTALDFDKDGTPDIAIANGGINLHSISIFLNAYNGVSLGRFNTGFPVIDIGIGVIPYSLYGNDFDSDGDIDLAVANSATNVTVYLNNGIAAPTPGDYPAVKASRAIVGIDFSGLGVMDLVVSSADGKLRILRDSVKTGLSPEISSATGSVGFGTTKDSLSTNFVLYSSVLATRIDSVSVGRPFYVVTQSVPKNLNPYDSLSVAVTFKPTAGALYRDTIRVYSSTSVPTVVAIPVSGSGDPSLGVQTISDVVPKTFSLDQNYPNPFNPTTTISYQVSAVSVVSLRVYDLSGREVAKLSEGLKNPGVYSVQWDASTFATGVYFCGLTAVSMTNGRMLFNSTMKMILVK